MGAHGFDDLSISNVHADVAALPDGQARRLRDGADGPLDGGVAVHRVRTDVRHPVGAVSDRHGVRVQPAVSFDQTDAVRRPAAQPLGADDVLIAAHTIRILTDFGLQQRLRQSLPEGSPDVPPAGLPGVGDVCHQILRILRGEVCKLRGIQLRDPAAAILDFSSVAIRCAICNPVIDRLGICRQVLCDGMPGSSEVGKGGLLIDRHRHRVGLFRIERLASVWICTGGHGAGPFLVADKAVRNVPCCRCGEFQVLISEAQGEEHRLDPVSIQARIFRFSIDFRHRPVQHLQAGLHNVHLSGIFRGHGGWDRTAVEHQVHGGVVMLGRAGEQR